MHAAGYDVRVVSASHTPWAVEADKELRATRSWRWTVVDYSRATARLLQIKTGARMRIAHALTRTFGSARVPAPSTCTPTAGRTTSWSARSSRSRPISCYGGTTGALAAVAEAADRLGIPYGLDLEDFHTGERSAMVGELNVVAERVERLVMPGAAFLTTSSPMIADAYAEKYGLRPRTIHNTFSLDLSQPQEPAERQAVAVLLVQPDARRREGAGGFHSRGGPRPNHRRAASQGACQGAVPRRPAAPCARRGAARCR